VVGVGGATQQAGAVEGENVGKSQPFQSSSDHGGPSWLEELLWGAVASGSLLEMRHAREAYDHTELEALARGVCLRVPNNPARQESWL
jgi:hypothetical protein